MPSYLNIASFIPKTTVLGPGVRSVIWVQGCPFHCKGCIAPEWILDEPANIIETRFMAQEILSIKGITGLTISGGEPMMQAAELSHLIDIVRREKDIDIICFTGFSIENLYLKSSNLEMVNLLKRIDLLIDGPYIDHLNDNKGLRGSSNQRFHYLTGRIKPQDFDNVPRKVEFLITNDSISIIGVPDQKSLDAFDHVLKKIGSGDHYERQKKSVVAA